jgi:putative transposase
VDIVRKNKKAIEEYIKNQQKEDMIADQISIKEYINPLKSGK